MTDEDVISQIKIEWLKRRSAMKMLTKVKDKSNRTVIRLAMLYGSKPVTVG